MSRFALSITQFLFFALLLIACRPKNVTWERIEKRGILQVGLDPTFAPFEMTDGQDVFGLDVDLAHAITEGLGLEVEYKAFSYDGLYDALGTGQVDVLISALVVMPERTKDFAYSDSYFNAGEILIVPVETPDIKEMVDLNGRRIAVELGAQGHVEATRWGRRLPDLTIRPYDSADQALASVAQGQSDAAVVDAVSGRLYLMHNPGLKKISEPVTLEPYAMVVRIEDEILLKKLNERLADLRESGKMEEIIATWLGE